MNWRRPTAAQLLFLALALPVPLMIAASLWMLPAPLLQILGAAVCLYLMFSVVVVRSLRGIFATTATIAIVLSIALSNWPLRAAFELSRPTFNEVARDVQHGKTLDAPTRIGLFTIDEVEMDQGVVCFWTRLRRSGRSGFVQCSPHDPPFNLWSHTVLDASWQYIEED